MTNFYRAFEERYRGDRDLIATRLTAYDSFTVPLAAACPGAVALDLGCGRGEWLELTARLGFAPFGVDLDEGMLAACRERGLHVATADALATLRARGDASVALISAFHLVEHLPFDLVQELVAEARRVLVPGGLLIMETPNPENIVVGTNNFYLDPSHVKPVPALLLGFLADFAGFARHTVVRLHGAPAADASHTIGLADVLQGVSYDYAIVAQKTADAAMLGAFDTAFAIRYGASLDQMAARFDQGWANALASIDARAAQAEALDVQARSQGQALAELDQGLRDVSGEFDNRLASLEDVQAGTRLDSLENVQAGARLDALEASDLDERFGALDYTVQALQERLQIDLALHATLQMNAMEKRMDAALDQIEARSARRASEAEARRLQREQQLQQRIDVVERHMEQADRRLAPLVRSLTTTQLEKRDAVAQVAEIQRHADYANWRLSVTEEELRQHRAQAAETEARLHALHAQFVSVVQSSSWRVTGPLRMLTRYGRRLQAAARDGRLLSGIQRRVTGDAPAPTPAGVPPSAQPGNSLRALQKRMKHSTVARRIVLPLLRRFPALEQPLRRLSDAPVPPAPAAPSGPAPLEGKDAAILLPAEFANMPDSSRQVLLDLVRAGLASPHHQP